MDEVEMYPPILNWLKSIFRHGLEPTRPGCTYNHVSMDVSVIDWFDGAGQWMRPDLAFVHVFRRAFDTSSTLDVHTFEVKTADADLLPALHQTLAHGRMADFVYLIAPHSPKWTDEVIAQAKRFGVGLIQFSDVKNFQTFVPICEPARMSPNADLRNQFLNAALTRYERKDDVISWLRA